MSNTALVTGASSGIGQALARYHASKGGDLVVTARREQALNSLKAELEGAHGIAVHVIAHDLGADGGQTGDRERDANRLHGQLAYPAVTPPLCA